MNFTLQQLEAVIAVARKGSLTLQRAITKISRVLASGLIKALESALFASKRMRKVAYLTTGGKDGLGSMNRAAAIMVSQLDAKNGS
jgi:hypothetical protein